MADEKMDLSDLALNRTASEKTKRRSMMSVFSRWIVPGVILLGFAAILYWAVLPKLISGVEVTLLKVRVEQGEVAATGTPLFRASGWVEPRPTPVYVSSLITGTVDELLVVEDQVIREGECVATLVDDDAKLKLRTAKAELLQRESALEQIRVRLKSAQIDFDQPVAKQVAVAKAEQSLAVIETMLSELPEQVVQAEATLSFAMDDLDTKMQAGTAISRIELDKAKSVHQAAVAKLQELKVRGIGLEAQKESALALLNATRLDLKLNNEAVNELGQAQAAELIAQAQLERAQVEVEEAELELARTKIISPSNGKVMRLMTSPGGHLSGGPASQGNHVGGVAVMLYDPGYLQIRVDVRFEDVRRVMVGQSVIIESPALEAPLEGVVLRVNPVADIQKNTLEVKVSIESEVETVKPEMLMNVTFLASAGRDDGTHESASSTVTSKIYIPDNLVHREDQATFVWLVDAATKTARKQAIVVDSVVIDSWVEVVKGLNVSSQVIHSSDGVLTDDAHVTVVGFSEE